MKCINKLAALGIVVSMLFPLTACSLFEKEMDITNRYDVYQTSADYGLTARAQSAKLDFFAKDLCVIGLDDIGTEQFQESLAGACGVFDLSNREVAQAKKVFEKMYPASTTKIMTCYLAVKYGSLGDSVTVSAESIDLPSDSSKCGLRAGDTITLEQLLYGLMLSSGNDAANVIAEHISGSVDSFVSLMNEEARALGATNTHFMNPHGLHEEEHYTCVYDLYLIFNAALQNEDFYRVVSTHEYEASYTHEDGSAATQKWETTNLYFSGNYTTPEGLTIIGGKTGTTNSAGSCLVLLSEKGSNFPYISIVLNAPEKESLYTCMSELLSTFTQ